MLDPLGFGVFDPAVVPGSTLLPVFTSGSDAVGFVLEAVSEVVADGVFTVEAGVDPVVTESVSLPSLVAAGVLAGVSVVAGFSVDGFSVVVSVAFSDVAGVVASGVVAVVSVVFAGAVAVVRVTVAASATGRLAMEAAAAGAAGVIAWVIILRTCWRA